MLVNALYYWNWQGFAGGERRIQIAKRAGPLDIFKHEEKKRWRQSCSLIGIFLQRSVQESRQRKSNFKRNQRNAESGEKREEDSLILASCSSLSFLLSFSPFAFGSSSRTRCFQIAERQVKKKKEAGKEKKGKREEKETYLTFSIMSSSFSLYSLRRETTGRGRDGWSTQYPLGISHKTIISSLSRPSLLLSPPVLPSLSSFHPCSFHLTCLSLSFLPLIQHVCPGSYSFNEKRARMRWVEKRTKTKL